MSAVLHVRYTILPRAREHTHTILQCALGIKSQIEFAMRHNKPHLAWTLVRTHAIQLHISAMLLHEDLRRAEVLCEMDAHFCTQIAHSDLATHSPTVVSQDVWSELLTLIDQDVGAEGSCTAPIKMAMWATTSILQSVEQLLAAQGKEASQIGLRDTLAEQAKILEQDVMMLEELFFALRMVH